MTSFSIALTSSAALGTSAELCREASSTDDYMTAGEEEEEEERTQADQNSAQDAGVAQFIKLCFGEKRSKGHAKNIPNISPPNQKKKN